MSRAIAIMAVLSLSATAFAAPMYEVANVQLVADHPALGGAAADGSITRAKSSSTRERHGP